MMNENKNHILKFSYKSNDKEVIPKAYRQKRVPGIRTISMLAEDKALPLDSEKHFSMQNFYTQPNWQDGIIF